MTEDVKHVSLNLDDAELARRLGTNVDVVSRNRAGFDLVRRTATGIRAARQARGWTQKQLAEALGVTVGRVSQYETGDLRHAPSLRTLADIAHALDMTAEVLLVSRSDAGIGQASAAADLFGLPVVAPFAGDVSVEEAASMDALSFAGGLHAAARRVVVEHPEMSDSPLLSDSVRSAIADEHG